MEKLIVGKVIRESKGICDWCGEEKEGFASYYPITLSAVALEDNFELDWFNRKKSDGFKFLSMEYKTDKQKLFWATESKQYKKIIKNEYALICKDCAKQLSK